MELGQTVIPDAAVAAAAAKGSSQYRGVSWHERSQRWEVRVWGGGKQHFIGECRESRSICAKLISFLAQLSVVFYNASLTVFCMQVVYVRSISHARGCSRLRSKCQLAS